MLRDFRHSLNTGKDASNKGLILTAIVDIVCSLGIGSNPTDVTVRRKIIATLCVKSALMMFTLICFALFEKYQWNQVATHDCVRSGIYFSHLVSLEQAKSQDYQYLSNLAGQSDSDIQISYTNAAAQAPKVINDEIVSSYNLVNFNDHPIVHIVYVRADPALNTIRTIAFTNLALLIAFGAINLITISICLLRWVSKPLDDIVDAVKTENIELLEPLLKESTELGDMARVVEDFLSQQQQLRDSRDFLEVIVQERTSELEEANKQLTNSYEAVIAGWGHALDIRDHETEGHCLRVTMMTMRLAKHFDFSEDQLVQVERGALLHDIGKMGVPDSVLLKQGELTTDERELMKRHTQYAYDMLYPIEFLRPALQIPFCHHEKWDGSGYPTGLKGEDIPLAARIFAVADVADALLSNRPYRMAWTRTKVRDHIKKLSGSHFDPKVVDIYLAETADEIDITLLTELENSPPLRLAA